MAIMLRKEPAVASDFITSGMKYMSKYISAPTDFNKIPHFDELMLGTQAIGSTLVIVFLYLRLHGNRSKK